MTKATDTTRGARALLDGPYGDYVRLAAQYHAEHPEQRLGQALSNVLRFVAPGLREEVLGDKLRDPFYVDSRVPAFLAFVMHRLPGVGNPTPGDVATEDDCCLCGCGHLHPRDPSLIEGARCVLCKWCSCKKHVFDMPGWSQRCEGCTHPIRNHYLDWDSQNHEDCRVVGCNCPDFIPD